MTGRARRNLFRACFGSARRAGLLLCLWLAGPASAAETVLRAWYDAPTDRYAHGVLGDDEEWGALLFEVGSCAGCASGATQVRRIDLPEAMVFEDLAPRLHDLDKDGRPEVIVIEAHSAQGARLAIYGPNGRIAATPYIGRSYRWLAPVGAADLDGDGRVEVAYVDRPHLAKVLRVWRYENGGLTPVADRAGLTNHRIGEDFISGGIRDCANGKAMITANADWSRIMASTLEDDRIVSRDIGPYRGRNSLTAAMRCP